MRKIAWDACVKSHAFLRTRSERSYWITCVSFIFFDACVNRMRLFATKKSQRILSECTLIAAADDQERCIVGTVCTVLARGRRLRGVAGWAHCLGLPIFYKFSLQKPVGRWRRWSDGGRCRSVRTSRVVRSSARRSRQVREALQLFCMFSSVHGTTDRSVQTYTYVSETECYPVLHEETIIFLGARRNNQLAAIIHSLSDSRRSWSWVLVIYPDHFCWCWRVDAGVGLTVDATASAATAFARLAAAAAAAPASNPGQRFIMESGGSSSVIVQDGNGDQSAYVVWVTKTGLIMKCP